MKISLRKSHPIPIFSSIFTLSLLIFSCFLLQHLSKTQGIINSGLKFYVNYGRILAEAESETGEGVGPGPGEIAELELLFGESAPFLSNVLLKDHGSEIKHYFGPEGRWYLVKVEMEMENNIIKNAEEKLRKLLDDKWNSVLSNKAAKDEDTGPIERKREMLGKLWNEAKDDWRIKYQYCLRGFVEAYHMYGWDDVRVGGGDKFAEYFSSRQQKFIALASEENKFLEEQ